MKLNRHFIVYTTDKETILVSSAESDFTGIVRGNHSLGAILELLKNGTGEESMIRQLRERFHAPEGVIEADVKKALSGLRKIGAIDDA